MSDLLTGEAYQKMKARMIARHGLYISMSDYIKLMKQCIKLAATTGTDDRYERDRLEATMFSDDSGNVFPDPIIPAEKRKSNARRGAAWLGRARLGRAGQGKAWHGFLTRWFFNKEEREMKTIEIEITGTTPLLCHRFGDDAAAAATNGSRTSIQTGDHGTPREQAEKCLYLHDGKSIIPGPNLFRAIIEAGKFFKSGKSKITTQKSSLIPACISLEEIVVPIKHKEPWTVDTRPVRIPATGGRILRHRPLFEDWQLKFSISVDTDMINEKLVREIIDAAGLRIGLGDFRPDCKGMYGKFKVTSWKKKK